MLDDLSRKTIADLAKAIIVETKNDEFDWAVADAMIDILERKRPIKKIPHGINRSEDDAGFGILAWINGEEVFANDKIFKNMHFEWIKKGYSFLEFKDRAEKRAAAKLIGQAIVRANLRLKKVGLQLPFKLITFKPDGRRWKFGGLRLETIQSHGANEDI